MRTERFPVKTTWIKEWVKLRKQPLPPSFARIAAQYGVSAGIVHRYVVAEIGKKSTTWRRRTFDYREARRLEEEEGWTRAKIAAHFNVTPAAITNALGPKHDPWIEAA